MGREREILLQTFYLAILMLPQPNEYVYAYQIFNASDSVNISKYSIPSMGEADNIGFFWESTDSTGILPNPAFTEIFGSAIWSFNGISFGPGEHSSILLFSSSAPPVLSGSLLQITVHPPKFYRFRPPFPNRRAC